MLLALLIDIYATHIASSQK